MKFSTVVALSFGALVSAQAPAAPAKGSGAAPKGGAGGAPRQAPAGACAAKCFAPIIKGSDCLKDVKLPSGMGGMGAMSKPPGGLQKRQSPAAGTTTAPKMPKGSLSPEAKSALGSAKAQASSINACLCKGPAFSQALASCVPSACASATPAPGAADPAAGFAKMVNGMCKGASGFTPLTAAGGAPAAKATGA